MKRMTQKQAEALRERALSFSRSITVTYLQFAAVLFEIKNSWSPLADGEVPLITMWGYKSWYEYVEHDLGMHWGRAQGLVKIYEVFMVECAGLVPEGELEEMGVTKLRDLSKVVTPRNIKGWMKRSKDASCCDVREAVRAAVEGRIGRSDRRTLHVEVSSATLEMVDEIVSIIRQDTELTDRGDIIEMVAKNYLAALKSKRRVKAA
jgi:hypothetical protein